MNDELPRKVYHPLINTLGIFSNALQIAYLILPQYFSVFSQYLNIFLFCFSEHVRKCHIMTFYNTLKGFKISVSPGPFLESTLYLNILCETTEFFHSLVGEVFITHYQWCTLLTFIHPHLHLKWHEIWRNVALHHLLTNRSSALNGCQY